MNDQPDFRFATEQKTPCSQKWPIFWTRKQILIEIFTDITVYSHAIVRNNTARAPVPLTQFPQR